MTDNNKWLIPGSIVIAGIIVAGAIVFAQGGGSLKNAGGDTQNPTPNPIVAATPTIDDDTVLGDPNAPVTYLEFGDYECPYCHQLFETEKQLIEEYVTTGKMRLVFRDFPLSFHPTARPSAEAAECAGEQGKYWAYHDALYTNQAEVVKGGYDYTKLAGQLGLNTTQFKNCVDTRQYQAEVEQDYQDGVAAGVAGTPTTFINGTAVEGAVPYATMKAAIEAALAKS